MEVGYHYFVFVIHSHKVGTWNQQRRQKGEMERKDESSPIFQCVTGTSTLFLDGTENTQHGGDKEPR